MPEDTLTGDTPTVPAEFTVETVGSVRKISLQLKAPYTFGAGQYLCVQHTDGTEIPLSIASAPDSLPRLELRFQPVAKDHLSSRMLDLLQDKLLNISPAQGAVTSQPYDKPLFIIAGGSGIAQAISCAADRHHANAPAWTKVLWCADNIEDAPDQNVFEAFANTEMTLKVDANRTPANHGLAWIREHASQLAQTRIILTGSPAFVYLVHDLLLELGLDSDNFSSDVYAYAPR